MRAKLAPARRFGRERSHGVQVRVTSAGGFGPRGFASCDTGLQKRNEARGICSATAGWRRTQFCALAEKACRDGFTALYTRATQLFRDFALAHADGSLRTLLARLARLDVLVVDDWAMAPLADTARRDFLEISEDRYQVRSTILTSQLPVAEWHEQIGDPTLADSILDRLVHNAHRIELRGESMRQKRGGQEP